MDKYRVYYLGDDYGLHMSEYESSDDKTAVERALAVVYGKDTAGELIKSVITGLEYEKPDDFEKFSDEVERITASISDQVYVDIISVINLTKREVLIGVCDEEIYS